MTTILRPAKLETVLGGTEKATVMFESNQHEVTFCYLHEEQHVPMVTVTMPKVCVAEFPKVWSWVSRGKIPAAGTNLYDCKVWVRRPLDGAITESSEVLGMQAYTVVCDNSYWLVLGRPNPIKGTMDSAFSMVLDASQIWKIVEDYHKFRRLEA